MARTPLTAFFNRPIVLSRRTRGLDDHDRQQLEKVQIELDQCWDLLRQRRALRGVGEDPDKAQVRPPEIVENYEQ